MCPQYDAVEAATDWQLEKLKEKLNDVKLDALYTIIDQWAGTLTQELDKLYQRQNENMVDVYNAVERLKENL